MPYIKASDLPQWRVRRAHKAVADVIKLNQAKPILRANYTNPDVYKRCVTVRRNLIYQRVRNLVEKELMLTYTMQEVLHDLHDEVMRLTRQRIIELGITLPEMEEY